MPENLEAETIALSPAELQQIEDEVPPAAGERYNEAGMGSVEL